MPRVPTVDGPQVTTAALPDAHFSSQISLSAAGAPGEALQHVASATDEIYQREKRKNDQLVVLDAERQLADFENKTLYDPQNGALNVRGKNALGLNDQVSKAYDQKVQDIEKGLSNPEQRVAFRRASDGRRSDINRTLERHVSSEMTNYDKQQTQSSIDTFRESAINNYQDPERVGLEIARQQAVYKDFANRNGMPPEWTAAQIQEATSKTHLGVLNRMLANGEDIGAKQYYTDHKPDISGQDAISVEKALEESSLRGESQRQADAIVQSTPDRMTALKNADAIKDPKLRDAVHNRINDHFNEQKAAQKEYQDQTYMKASDLIENNGGDLRQINPKIWTDMTLNQRNALEARARQVQKGVEPVLNDKKWLEFSDKTANDLRQMSESDMLSQYRPYFDNSHWDRAISIWASVRDTAQHKHKADSNSLTKTLSFRQRVSNTMRSTGLIDENQSFAKLPDDKAAMFIKFEEAGAKAVEDFETEKGRKATGNEIQGILNDMALKRVFIDQWGRDPQKPVAVLSPEEAGKSYVPYENIPQSDVAFMTNLIISKQRRVTEDKIQRAYAQYLLNNRDAFMSILGE